MKTWQRLKAWAIRKLGGQVEHVEDLRGPMATTMQELATVRALAKNLQWKLDEKPTELYLRHEQLTFMPLDRPFDPIDWERLATLGQRERVYFEWLAHRINHLDAQASRYKVGPDADRDRLVYLARRDEIMRSFDVSREASEKLIKLLRSKEKSDRMQAVEKGLNNHGG